MQSNKVEREVHTFMTSWKVAIFILAQDFFMKVKFLIFLQIPLFFHDTDGVKKKEGKVNIKLSFVWLLGEGEKWKSEECRIHTAQ